MSTLGPILIGLVAAAVIIGARWVLLRVFLRPAYRRVKLPVFFGLLFLASALGAVFLREEPLLQVGLGAIALILLWAALGVALQWPGFRDTPPSLIREYQVVRIARMDRPHQEYVGWGNNRRPPQIGEMGAIVEVSERAGKPGEVAYIVEGPTLDGEPAWVAEFLEDELQVVSNMELRQ